MLSFPEGVLLWWRKMCQKAWCHMADKWQCLNSRWRSVGSKETCLRKQWPGHPDYSQSTPGREGFHRNSDSHATSLTVFFLGKEKRIFYFHWSHISMEISNVLYGGERSLCFWCLLMGIQRHFWKNLSNDIVSPFITLMEMPRGGLPPGIQECRELN